MFSKRFLPWMVLFLVLLGLIPVLVSKGNINGAKVLGVLTIVGVSVALNVWRIQTRKKHVRAQRIRLNLNDRFWLKEHIHFYNILSKADRRVFEERVGLFLTQVTITEIGQEEVEKSTCLYVAASAVMAYWGLPYWNYADLKEVLVYPENFNESMQFNTAGEIQGQIHHGGMMNNTMILSLRALEHGFKNAQDKKNVGVHEFAHLLDKMDGYMDGVPAGMDKSTTEVWVDLMHKEIKKIQKSKSDINPYGASNQAEFFAVVTEYYKERPELLKRKHPKIFAVMETYFNQDPVRSND